tara:strand:+ start:265 stop:513 length:249 start_codon:yes stop_codon:yes gene_type:complete
MNKFNLAIIGSSRIAEIHYKFLNKYNFCKIYFVGRKKEKIISFLKKHKIKDTKTLTKKILTKKILILFLYVIIPIFIKIILI